MTSTILKEKLLKQGANDQQLNSKIVRLCENAIAEMSQQEINAITLQQIQDLIINFETMKTHYQITMNGAENIFGRLNAAMKKAESIKDGIINETNKIEIIPTEETKQAIYLFKSVLQTTKEVFGDDISNETMQMAIQAGSYGMWRSIMGEAKPSTAKRII